MMNVLYTCDDNYVWLMGISMLSLFENNKDLDAISVYLLGERISEENKSKLKDIADKYKRECIIIEMPELDIPQSLVSKRWPKSAFSRLYAANILPDNLDSILYLDCDTVIMGSLSYMDKLNNSDCVIYGVRDCIGEFYRKNIGLNRKSLYVNAGVLLMNLEKMRKINISQIIDSFLSEYGQLIHYADQDVLNGIFKGEFGVLPAEYDVMTLEYMYSYDNILRLRDPINFYSKDEIEKAVNNPVIVHFTTCMLNVRPWFKNTNHPKAAEFLHYKDMSPWKEIEAKEYVSNGGVKDKVFKILGLLPEKTETMMLGLIHSKLYPFVISKKTKKH